MTKAATIMIDDQPYDAETGLPITSKSSVPTTSSTTTPVISHQTAATSLHVTTQRSTTLHRKFIKKPVNPKHAIVNHQSVKHMDIARPHKNVHKFAQHPVGALRPKTIDIGPVTHPHVAKAHALSAAKAKSLSDTLTAANIKNEAVKTAVANTHKKPLLKTRFALRQRVIGIVSASFALILLGGYFTYLNMPSLSVRVAAAQAGIDANYPNYRPDGYALNGPVTYTDGRVSMNFKANGGNQSFAINQSKSGWDSDALLDNYVSPRAGSDYVPYTERGLTIYTYKNDAAWVNGGILYTVEGNAPLSSSQIRRIATSLL